MARGSNKRVAESPLAEEPEAKRAADFLQEQDVSERNYQPVLDAMRHPLSGLSDSDRAFVLAVLPWSLAVPADRRHELQDASVGMVAEIVHTVQAKLQMAVDVETERIDELEATRAELDTALNQSEAVKTEAHQAVEERAAQLAEAEVTVVQKRTVHEESKLEQKRLAAELQETSTQMSALDEALSNGFEKLKNGSCEEGETEGLAAAVVDAAKKSSLEESLVTALSSSLAKRERGAFDVAVIHEAEQSFRGRIAALSEIIEVAAEPLAAQAAAVQTAQSELDTAMADQVQAAEILRSAQEASSGAVVAAQAAKDAVGELDNKLAALTAVKSQKSAELQQFCDDNVSMFKLLRDRVSKQSEETAQEPVEVASKESAGEQGAGVAAPLAGA